MATDKESHVVIVATSPLPPPRRCKQSRARSSRPSRFLDQASLAPAAPFSYLRLLIEGCLSLGLIVPIFDIELVCSPPSPAGQKPLHSLRTTSNASAHRSYPSATSRQLSLYLDARKFGVRVTSLPDLSQSSIYSSNPPLSRNQQYLRYFGRPAPPKPPRPDPIVPRSDTRP